MNKGAGVMHDILGGKNNLVGQRYGLDFADLVARNGKTGYKGKFKSRVKKAVSNKAYKKMKRKGQL